MTRTNRNCLDNIVKKNYTGINDNKKGMVRRRRWQKHYLGGTYYLRCATPRKKSKRLLRRADSSRYEPSIAGSAAVAILRNRRLFPYEMATNSEMLGPVRWSRVRKGSQRDQG